MAAKYREYFMKMLDDNKKIFDNFQSLHDKYSQSQESHQEMFNAKGEEVLEIVREYENRLCTNTERGMYNKYSTGLAEKFQNEVRKHFPLIDHVGLKIQKASQTKDGKFFLKKINLR